MKVGELKRAVARYPADMDNEEVLMLTCTNGKKEYDLLAGCGYLLMNDKNPLVLVANNAVEPGYKEGQRISGEKLPPPPIENSDGTVEGDEWKNG